MLQVEPVIVERLVREPRGRPEVTVERLLHRARALPEADRLLVELALRNRVSRRQIGILLGLSTGGVCRRLHRLTTLLQDPLTIALLEARDQIPAEAREIGIDHFIRQRSVRAISHQRGVPQSYVTRLLDYIRAWHEYSNR